LQSEVAQFVQKVIALLGDERSWYNVVVNANTNLLAT